MQRERILIVILTWLYLSSFILAIIYYFSGLTEKIYWLKDLGAFGWLGMLTIGLSFPRSLIRYIGVLLPIIVYICISCATHSVPLLPMLASSRQLISIFLFIVVGIAFSGNGLHRNWLHSQLVLLLVAIALFGFIERATDLWSMGILVPYFSAKGIASFSSGYPTIFIEPYNIIGTYLSNQLMFHFGITTPGIIRMTSTLLDPIDLGHSMVLLIVLGHYGHEYIRSATSRKLIVTIGIVGLLLTISKGAFLQLLIIYSVLNPRFSKIQRISAVVILCMMVLFVGHYDIDLWVHVAGIYAAFSSISLFGHGIGTVGNYATMLGSSLKLGISDSFIGALVGELGVVGAILWLMPLIYVSNKLGWHHLFVRILWSQVIISMLSENAFNLVSVAGIGILLGSELRYFAAARKYNQLLYSESFYPSYMKL